MGDPARGISTTTNRIHITWSALSDPDTGDSPILSYHLVWDAGSGTVN